MVKILKIIILFFSFSLYLYSNPQKEQIPAITPLSWLKQNYNSSNIVIIDLRPYEEYKKGI